MRDGSSLIKGIGELKPMAPVNGYGPVPEDMEALSKIIETLNTRFGTEFSDDDRLSIQQLEQRLSQSEALEASRRANPPERVRLTFDHVVEDALQGMVNTHFKFYKQVTDNPDFAKVLLDWLFDRYLRSLPPSDGGGGDASGE